MDDGMDIGSGDIGGDIGSADVCADLSCDTNDSLESDLASDEGTDLGAEELYPADDVEIPDNADSDLNYDEGQDLNTADGVEFESDDVDIGSLSDTNEETNLHGTNEDVDQGDTNENNNLSDINEDADINDVSTLDNGEDLNADTTNESVAGESLENSSDEVNEDLKSPANDATEIARNGARDDMNSSELDLGDIANTDLNVGAESTTSVLIEAGDAAEEGADLNDDSIRKHGSYDNLLPSEVDAEAEVITNPDNNIEDGVVDGASDESSKQSDDNEIEAEGIENCSENDLAPVEPDDQTIGNGSIDNEADGIKNGVENDATPNKSAYKVDEITETIPLRKYETPSAKDFVLEHEYKKYSAMYDHIDTVDVPLEYKSGLIERYQGMDEELKLTYNNFASKLDVTDSEYQGVPRFNSETGDIKLNWREDVNHPLGSGNTYFHETGHAIDHYKGLSNGSTSLSEQNGFTSLAQQDLDDSVSRIMKSEGYTREQAQDAITADLMSDPNASNCVSDVFGGLTQNQIHGVWGHRNQYWTDRGGASGPFIGGEAFAEIHADVCCKNANSLSYTSTYLPRTLARYYSIMGGRRI